MESLLKSRWYLQVTMECSSISILNNPSKKLEYKACHLIKIKLINVNIIFVYIPNISHSNHNTAMELYILIIKNDS